MMRDIFYFVLIFFMWTFFLYPEKVGEHLALLHIRYINTMETTTLDSGDDYAAQPAKEKTND